MFAPEKIKGTVTSTLPCAEAIAFCYTLIVSANYSHNLIISLPYPIVNTWYNNSMICNRCGDKVDELWIDLCLRCADDLDLR
jgi:hypothetical protein